MARPYRLLASVAIVVCGCTSGAASDESLLDHLYYHVGEDGVSELLGALDVEPLRDEAAMQGWQEEGRPRMQVAQLSDLRESASPQWRDSATGEIVPSLGRLDNLVTESGACSAEKFLDDYRDAGCVP